MTNVIFSPLFLDHSIVSTISIVEKDFPRSSRRIIVHWVFLRYSSRESVSFIRIYSISLCEIGFRSLIFMIFESRFSYSRIASEKCLCPSDTAMSVIIEEV